MALAYQAGTLAVIKKRMGFFGFFNRKMMKKE